MFFADVVADCRKIFCAGGKICADFLFARAVFRQRRAIFIESVATDEQIGFLSGKMLIELQ